MTVYQLQIEGFKKRLYESYLFSKRYFFYFFYNKRKKHYKKCDEEKYNHFSSFIEKERGGSKKEAQRKHQQKYLIFWKSNIAESMMQMGKISWKRIFSFEKSSNNNIYRIYCVYSKNRKHRCNLSSGNNRKSCEHKTKKHCSRVPH